MVSQPSYPSLERSRDGYKPCHRRRYCAEATEQPLVCRAFVNWSPCAPRPAVRYICAVRMIMRVVFINTRRSLSREGDYLIARVCECPPPCARPLRQTRIIFQSGLPQGGIRSAPQDYPEEGAPALHIPSKGRVWSRQWASLDKHVQLG